MSLPIVCRCSLAFLVVNFFLVLLPVELGGQHISELPGLTEIHIFWVQHSTCDRAGLHQMSVCWSEWFRNVILLGICQDVYWTPTSLAKWCKKSLFRGKFRGEKKGHGLWNPLGVTLFALPVLDLLLLDHQTSVYFFYFLHMSALPPSVCSICIKLLPGTPAWNTSKQPPLLNEQFPSPQRPSVPFPSHTQPCLACGTRVSSLSCTWFLFGCQHSELLLAVIAPGLCTSKLVLMSSQHKHKYVRKRCMG